MNSPQHKFNIATAENIAISDSEISELLTQVHIRSAQRLYESTGFIHAGKIERNGREFKVYERTLAPKK